MERSRTRTLETGASLLTIPEAAERLGVSRVTLYRAVQNGSLGALRLGEHGRLRVPREALAAYARPVRVEREEPTQ